MNSFFQLFPRGLTLQSGAKLAFILKSMRVREQPLRHVLICKNTPPFSVKLRKEKLIKTQEGKGGGRKLVINMFQFFFLWGYPQAEDFNEVQSDGRWDNIQGRCFCRIALNFPAVLVTRGRVGAGWTCDMHQHHCPWRPCLLWVSGGVTERWRLKRTRQVNRLREKTINKIRAP